MKRISFLICSTLLFVSSFALADEYTIENYAYEGTLGQKIKVRIVLEKRSDGLVSGVLTYLKYNKSFRVIGSVDRGLFEYQANGEVSGSIEIDSQTLKPTEWSSMQKPDLEYSFNIKTIKLPHTYTSTFEYGDTTGVFSNIYTNPYRGNSNKSELKISANGDFVFSDFSTSPYSDFKTTGKLQGNKAELYVKECMTTTSEDFKDMPQYNYDLSTINTLNFPKFTVEVFKDFAYVKDFSTDAKCEGFSNYGLTTELIRIK